MFFGKKPPSSVEHLEEALLDAQKTIGTLLNRVLLLEHTMARVLDYSGELAKHLLNVQTHHDEVFKEVYGSLESTHETIKVMAQALYEQDTESNPVGPIK